MRSTLTLTKNLLSHHAGRAALSSALLGPLLVACLYTPPGQLGAMRRFYFDHPLGDAFKGAPLAEGETFVLGMTERDCNPPLFATSADEGCEEVTTFRVDSTDPDVVTVEALRFTETTYDRAFTVTARRAGIAFLQVMSGGDLLDFLPLEVARPAQVAVSDEIAGLTAAKALGNRVAIPAGAPVTLQVGLADETGRMIYHAAGSLPTVEVREGDVEVAITPAPAPIEATLESTGQVLTLNPDGVGHHRLEIRAPSIQAAPLSLVIDVVDGNRPDQVRLDVLSAQRDSASGDGYRVTLWATPLVEVAGVGPVVLVSAALFWDFPEGFMRQTREDGDGTRRVILQRLPSATVRRDENIVVGDGVTEAVLPAILLDAQVRDRF